jgi:hypothetical protein
VTVVVPTANVELDAVALPPDKLTGLPKFTPLTWNCTVPVGVGPVPLMVAVKVTGWLATDGFAEEVRVVTLFAVSSLPIA